MTAEESISQIGPYVLDEELGSGGMGTVYLSHHTQTGDPAAVKVLPASLAREEGFVERFVREINVLKQLKNPNIVALNDSGVDDGVYYYAMEYVDGETVAERLRRDRRIEWEQVVDYGIQICSALKAAHDAGIIHRDLKPSNLMVTTDGVVKLTDFGIAQIFAASRLTRTGGIIGTATFMSPEQAQGRRATRQSDLYSLGVVMYLMLTGNPPFVGKTTLELLQKHRFSQFDMPRSFVPEIPHWLEDVVCKLLEKEPQDRFPDAYVLSLRLKEVLKKVEISSQEPTIGANENYDGSATTVAASGDLADQGPGAATLMRDLMRVEIERSHQKSPLGNLFNNIWFLIVCLALLIAGGAWWFRDAPHSAEERFQSGVALLEQVEGPAWLTARDEYFLPLLADDPERWRERLDPYLQQIEEYELRRSLRPRRSLRKPKPPESEAERFLFLAERYWEMGDLPRAKRTLAALEALLAGQAEFEKLHKLTKQRLQELRAAQVQRDREHRLLDSSLARARKLAESDRRAEARRIWAGIVELYSPDQSAADFVQEAKRSLSQHAEDDQ